MECIIYILYTIKVIHIHSLNIHDVSLKTSFLVPSVPNSHSSEVPLSSLPFLSLLVFFTSLPPCLSTTWLACLFLFFSLRHHSTFQGKMIFFFLHSFHPYLLPLPSSFHFSYMSLYVFRSPVSVHSVLSVGIIMTMQYFSQQSHAACYDIT